MTPVTSPGGVLPAAPLPADQDDLLSAQLQWSMLARLVAVTALFGLVLFLSIQGEGPVGLLATLYPVFVAFYALAALYALVARRMPNLVFFTYLQFAVDAACIGLILVFTGGARSMFTWVFVFNVLGAGYLLQLRGGLAVATLDTAAYLSCLALSWFGVIPSWGPDGLVTIGIEGRTDNLREYSTVAFHVVSFYLLAFLSGSLSRKQAETGRVLAETASNLNRLQNMHGRIVQNLDAGLLTVDPEGRITSFNRAAEEITRYLATEAIGRQVGEILRGVGRLLADSAESDSNTMPGPSLERWMTRRDHKRVYLRVSASLMRDAEGRVDGQILVFEDRTRLLLMEEQLQREERLAAVGRLSAAIAHEIRNPLASITGSVQVLRQELDLACEDDELMGLIEREAGRLGDLVTDFLQLTRGDQLDPRPGTIAVIARETLALIPTRGVSDRIEVTAELDYDPVIRIDGPRMRQVLWNLVLNACQAMPGGGRLRVRTERVTADDLGGSGETFAGHQGRGGEHGGPGRLQPGEGALRLVVEDTGSGISDDDLGRIFDPFFTTRSGGTGLGLAIVASIVQAHGGVVTVSSHPGAGTRFAIWLPIEDEQAGSSAAPGAAAGQDGADAVTDGALVAVARPEAGTR